MIDLANSVLGNTVPGNTVPRRALAVRSVVIGGLLVALLAAFPASAQTDCADDPACVPPPPGEGEPLQEYFIESEGGKLDTTLDVRYFTNVPVGGVNMNLRMYGRPENGKIVYTLPGPFYRIHKGEKFNLTLTNSIAGAPSFPHHACNPLDPPVSPSDVPPNCYHGNNVTNFHFHGFHISPQRIDHDHFHDYIFLKLIPRGETCPEYPKDEDCVEGIAYLESGTIPADQAEGTHWYHPHHHGSTARQVMNGMAGAFLVEGKFDEDLRNFYGGQLEEKVLVLQQIADITFPNPIPGDEFLTLVNGQLSPTVAIGAGEIERWRLVNASASLRSHTTYTFPKGYEVKQIAMDGVQFAPENYDEQPLLEGDDEVGYSITLAAGNRADFLVKGAGTTEDFLHAPAEPTLLQSLGRRKLLRGQVRPLLTVTPDPEDRRTADQQMRFPKPSEWPAMPAFLRNVEIEDDDRHRCIDFSMAGARNDPNDIVQFLIDGKKFDPKCIDQRMTLDSKEEWSFINRPAPNLTIPHPAHIHVNPFQVWVRDGVSHVDRWNPYPIWQDTIALSTDPEELTVIRSRFETFEGRFVMHCHILGHEDRGMMQQLEVGDESDLPLCKPYDADPRCESRLRRTGGASDP